MIKRFGIAAAGVALALFATPTPTGGYAIEVHKDFYDHAFQGQAAGRTVEPPTAEDLVAFRTFIWERAGADPAFRARWPSAAAFDAAALKEFLQLNPGKRVVGIDFVPADRPTDVRTVVREGSVDPDNDDRNQDRFWIRDDGTVALDPFGRAVPDDPLTVWFGGRTGTASQFDAHGATRRDGEKTDSIVKTLAGLSPPDQYADPARPLGSAPEFSETYTELAMIARLWGGHGSEWLALTFGGNNLHGIEDLGNQIHTTVVGTRAFMVDALKTFAKAKVASMFRRREEPSAEGFTAPDALTAEEVNAAMALIKVGREDEVDPQVRWALGHEPKPAPGLTETGARIISNHHLLLEDFVQQQYLDAMAKVRAGRADEVPAAIRDVIQRAQDGDPEFEAACRARLAEAGLDTAAPGATPYAQVLAEVMIERSAPEAETIYCAIREISKKELQRGAVYDHKLGHEPLDFVTTSDPEDDAVAEIWELTGRAFARVVTAIRLWDETYRAETAGVAPGSREALARAERVVDRLVGRQLERIEAAEARRADYLEEVRARYAEEHGALPEGATGLTGAVEGAR